ncbi:putative POTE ankyrin domain family member M isoform X4 [Polypterus senegalus]|uniref:putative POTE ankyrin domain family member M isoform X4 n=1 Tax=Polypterus senegalus TaxID=55291 RepID=UPI00196413E9|nr:putative POTE ankyrin domain family member M isoform X4 [Polypterus senegalus]
MGTFLRSVWNKIVNKDRLHKAAAEGDLSKVKELLSDIEVNQRDKNNRTALHMAAAKGHVEVIRLLAENNANLNLWDNSGETPLMTAVTRQKRECAFLLLDLGADTGIVSHHEDTVLHHAAAASDIALAARLLEIKTMAKNIDFKNRDLYTPLHLAVAWNHKEMVEFLLKMGADINSVSVYKRTPLMFAAIYGYPSIVKLLLQYNAGICVTDVEGMTANDFAVMLKNNECSKIIMEYADIKVFPKCNCYHCCEQWVPVIEMKKPAILRKMLRLQKEEMDKSAANILSPDEEQFGKSVSSLLPPCLGKQDLENQEVKEVEDSGLTQSPTKLTKKVKETEGSFSLMKSPVNKKKKAKEDKIPAYIKSPSVLKKHIEITPQLHPGIYKKESPTPSVVKNVIMEDQKKHVKEVEIPECFQMPQYQKREEEEVETPECFQMPQYQKREEELSRNCLLHYQGRSQEPSADDLMKSNEKGKEEPRLLNVSKECSPCVCICHLRNASKKSGNSHVNKQKSKMQKSSSQQSGNLLQNEVKMALISVLSSDNCSSHFLNMKQVCSGELKCTFKLLDRLVLPTFFCFGTQLFFFFFTR